MDYQGKEISRLMGVFLTYMKVQYESVNTFSVLSFSGFSLALIPK